MTFFASLALFVVLVIRPQEIWPVLESLHVLDVLTGLAVLGLIAEVVMGKQRDLYSPQLPFLGAFVGVSFFVTALALGAGRGVTLGNKYALIPAIFMLVIMYGSRAMPRLQTMVWTILLVGAFVAAVAVHQGSVSPVCMQRVVDDNGESVPDVDTADGRVCGIPSDCLPEGSFDPDEWACERLGLFKTMSVAGRVRWRGQLEDPNELSVFIGAVIPLMLAVGLPFRNAASNRTPARQKWLATIGFLMIGVGLYAVILTQSRGGQLVIATVFTLLFVSRFGAKGIVGAVLLALPVLLLGGRDDAAADESSMDRLELLTEGITLIITHPFRGVGLWQFSDQVASPLHLTAHNSYVLAAAETGLFGFFSWSGILWTSLKIPLVALKTPTLSAEIRAIANALLVSFGGLVVGIFFLSFTYKQLLFVWFGLAGALYGIMRQSDATLKVTVGWKDFVGLVCADVGIIALLYLYTRAKGAH